VGYFAIGSLTQVLAASGAMIPNNDESLPMPGFESQPTELPRGAFLGKSLPAAIKLYFSAMKKKQTIREIATALREGGVASTSDNFEGVITGCLNRMKSNGEILRFNDGWALAEFYPENLRNRLSHGSAKKTANKNAKNPKKPNKSGKSTRQPGEKSPTIDGLEQKIEAYARTRQGELIGFRDVLSAIPGASTQAASLTLGRIAKKKGWERSEDGKYRVGPTNVQEMPKAV
jgi:hypothetical protein